MTTLAEKLRAWGDTRWRHCPTCKATRNAEYQRKRYEKRREHILALKRAAYHFKKEVAA